jgi:hypothetical protein
VTITSNPNFRRIQQLAVLKLRVPQHFDEGAHLMSGQETPDADRHVLIKYDAQRGDS